MPRPGVIPGGFGELFSTALWELGLGFSVDQITLSLEQLFPGTTPLSSQMAIQLAQQSQYAGAGVSGLTGVPFGGPAPIPTVAGIQGGYYYDVDCDFLNAETGDTEDRLVRVTSDTPLTESEIFGRAYDQAVYYQEVTGSPKFEDIDLKSARGRRAVSCRVAAAYQGIG